MSEQHRRRLNPFSRNPEVSQRRYDPFAWSGGPLSF
jgi:hypothetical protein